MNWETFGATWKEADFEATPWTVPKERMKARREYRVPLTPRAVEILKVLSELGAGPDAYLLQGQKQGRPLSIMAMDDVAADEG